ncbi:MAG TPA: hypothetical protein DHW82_07705 [Spirochaetia bacterium]|nr:MAG: hypothetical protein A2Y41_02395 [Spirochaetes bacterium GWB1_36_13]HCL56879.1 hypothetical protein [Spirochaetia bacterium]
MDWSFYHQEFNRFLEEKKEYPKNISFLQYFLQRVALGIASDFKVKPENLNWKEIFEIVWSSYQKDFQDKNLTAREKTACVSGGQNQ